jgi:hypothetical protein
MSSEIFLSIVGAFFLNCILQIGTRWNAVLTSEELYERSKESLEATEQLRSSYQGILDAFKGFDGLAELTKQAQRDQR